MKSGESKKKKKESKEFLFTDMVGTHNLVRNHWQYELCKDIFNLL